MRALIVNDTGLIAIDGLPIPEGRGECLIRVQMAGICGTDLELLKGYADFRGIPGHEFVGTVVAAPHDETAWVGKRVVGEINVGCGSCEWCRSGVKEHCPARTVVGIRGRGGAFAEYLSLPAANLHEVPDGVDDETAVFVEPVAAACRVLEQLQVHEGTKTAILGDGRLALLIAQVLTTKTPHVTVLGRHDRKMEVARMLGITARGATTEDQGRYDVVVDATGQPAALMEATGLVKPRGTVVMKSTVHGEAAVTTWPIVVNEVTLMGSRCGPFAAAIGLLSKGTVKVGTLVSRVFLLEDCEQAFDAARHGLKVLFDLRGL